MSQLPHFVATRYLCPLREGGSLPAVVDTDGGGLFVVKFRGAGQGPKALVAELVVGLLAAELELPVPGLARVEILPDFGRSEPDPEIQDLLRASSSWISGSGSLRPNGGGTSISASSGAGSPTAWARSPTTSSAISTFAPCPAPRNLTTNSPPPSVSTTAGSDPPSRRGWT